MPVFPLCGGGIGAIMGKSGEGERGVREITGKAAMERSLVKRFRKELWQPFIAACKRWRLVTAGDRIAVALDGTAAAAVNCLLLLELARHSDEPFSLAVLDAGGGPLSAGELGIDALPCPGEPAAAAREWGANRLAVPDCMSDVTETVFGGMLYEGTLRAFLPLEPDSADPALTLIRPLYCVERRDILAFCRYNTLPYASRPDSEAKRKARALLDEMRAASPNVEISIFRAAHQVHVDTFPRPLRP